MTICVEQDVFWFEISVDNVVLMEVFECEYEFCNVEFGSIFLESAFFLQMPKQLTTGHEIRH